MLGIVGRSPTPSPLPSIGYLGSTYDIFKGNPYSTKGRDPGFTFRNLYQFTYTDGHTTPDGHYSIPDHTEARLSSSCFYQFQSSSIQNLTSYLMFLHDGVHTEFEGWEASFSGSRDYIDIYQGCDIDQMRYVFSTAKCEAYEASVENAKLNPAFVSAVRYLPVDMSSNASEYINFLNSWGTHVARGLKMGSQFGFQSSFSGPHYTSMVASGLDILASAGYSAFVSIDAKEATDEQINKARAFESYRDDYQVYHIGSIPPLYGNTTSLEWKKMVINNPLPFFYDLDPLAVFLTTDNFPSDKDIEAKRSNLEMATVKYCHSLEFVDTDLCGNQQPHSGDSIPATFVNTYSPLSCDKTSNHNFIVQEVDDSILYIIGTMMSVVLAEHIDYSTLVARKPSSSLLQAASNWTKNCDSDISLCVLQPSCESGFSPVSDFACCSNNIDNCLVTLPRALPCIADKCLAQCGFDQNNNHPFLSGVLQPISFGNPHYGNSYNNSGPQFFKFTTGDDKFVPKCLNFNCIHYN